MSFCELDSSMPEARRSSLYSAKTLILFLLILVPLSLCGLILRGCTNGHSRAHGHGNISFEISRAGDMIVFNAAGEGQRDLYVLRAGDLSVTRIAATPEYETTPSFAPDGESVVFAAGVPGDRADHIFIRSLNGSSVRQITRADANDSSPRVSPDGSLVVFDRDKTYNWGGLAANWDRGGVICVIGIDGKNERQLTSDDTLAYEPWFLPDDKTVGYSTLSGIYAVSLDGSSSPRLLADLQGPHEVAPSPDGKYFAYTRGQYSGSQALLFANADGTGERRIAAKVGAYYRPQFSPKGDQLYFCQEEWPDGPTGSPQFSLWRIDIDGRNLREVASAQLFNQPLRWQRKRSQIEADW